MSTRHTSMPGSTSWNTHKFSHLNNSSSIKLVPMDTAKQMWRLCQQCHCLVNYITNVEDVRNTTVLSIDKRHVLIHQDVMCLRLVAIPWQICSVKQHKLAFSGKHYATLQLLQQYLVTNTHKVLIHTNLSKVWTCSKRIQIHPCT